MDKSKIFVSVFTLESQNNKMTSSMIKTTVSYHLYAWKVMIATRKSNKRMVNCVYFHQNVTILCSNNHTYHVILTVWVSKRFLQIVICIIYAYTYFMSLLINCYLCFNCCFIPVIKNNLFIGEMTMLTYIYIYLLH